MITETVRIGCCFYEDLALTPDIESALIHDRLLSEDAYFFAHCIREYLDLVALHGQRHDIRVAEPVIERLH